jgi:hypothetical protein
MIRVEIEQDYDAANREWFCHVYVRHAADGEFPASTESYTVGGEWPAAIDVAREKYGSEISSLSVEWVEKGGER